MSQGGKKSMEHTQSRGSSTVRRNTRTTETTGKKKSGVFRYTKAPSGQTVVTLREETYQRGLKAAAKKARARAGLLNVTSSRTRETA